MIPSRVVLIMGGKCTDLYEVVRGRNHVFFIAGPSVHNTRVEKLWRDVSVAVSSTYTTLFIEMENRGLLNPISQTCLSS